MIQFRYFIYVYYFCSTDFVELQVSESEFQYYLKRVSCNYSVQHRLRSIDSHCDCMDYFYINDLGHIINFGKIETWD